MAISARSKNLICVVGARPNFMKMKPVVDALEGRGANVSLVHTGQHFDPQMSAVFFEDLGLRASDHHLGVGSGSHAHQTGRIMMSFEPVVNEFSPDVVVVAGDVNSTLAAALVAAKLHIPVAHVEAGLRSRDLSMPEEVNRLLTDHVSDYLFTPSEDADENLVGEGIDRAKIYFVGNVMVDSLLAHLDDAARSEIITTLGLPERYGVITLHRPENVDHPEILGELMAALIEVADELPLVLPAHPRVAAAFRERQLPPTITITEPLGYVDFLALEDRAALVLTDSGGIQEETTILGVPCLTLRDSTERPVTVSHGTNVVVGRDRAAIVKGAREALAKDRAPSSPPLWDGRAAARIADVLMA